MARDRNQNEDYVGPLRRLLLAVLVVSLAGIFLVWRIDSPRVEQFRAQVVDQVVPSMSWAMKPVSATIDLLRNFQSYQRIVTQNQELRRELRQMKAWKEAALQLEQENARLLELNNVRLDPRLTYVTGVVLADSGSPFRQSVLLNIGARDGVLDGWAAMDGSGLVGRISGVGDTTSRVILLTDTSSRVPVKIQPSGVSALIVGDNSLAPLLDFVENSALVAPGDRVVSSGDGGVFPDDLLVGQVALDPSGRMRLRLAADNQRLEFLRVLRHQGTERVQTHGSLITPVQPANPDTGEAPQATADSAEGDDG